MKKSIFFIIFGAVILLNFNQVAGYCEDNDYTVCYRRNGCNGMLDSEIVYALQECRDPEVNACENYFDSSHGQRRFNSYGKTILEDTQENYNKLLADAVETLYNKGLGNLKVAMLKYLRQCKSESNNFQNHIPPLLDGLEDIENLHWPNWTLALKQEEWEQRDFHWTNALGELRRFGLNNIFFKEHVTLAYNDASKVLIELNLPEEVEKFPEDAEFTFKIFNMMEKREYEHVKFMAKINELDDLVRKLRQKHGSIDNAAIERPERVTLTKLKNKIPLIDWEKYFSALLKRPIVADSLEIQLRNPGYLQDIATLIDQTDEKELAFYILLRFVYFYFEITPRDVNLSCEESLANQFSFGANLFYNQTYGKNFEETKTSLKEIFEALKAKFLRDLNKNKYKLSVAALTYLKEKLIKMELRIGNTPLEMPLEYFDQFYKNANIRDTSSLVENVREMMRFRVSKLHEMISTAPAQVDLDYLFAYEDNFEQPIEPFYVARGNFIVLPQQFLAPPFAAPAMHKIFQYATSGFGIARALMEAFMADGLIYDAQGLENRMGFEILQNEKYQTDLNCIRNASKNFTELLPDIPALQLVIDTFYKDIPNSHEGVLELHLTQVLDKTHNMKDLFFRFFAQYFRGNTFYAPKFSIDERLNNIVPHIPQFAEHYNCTINTDNCCLW